MWIVIGIIAAILMIGAFIVIYAVIHLATKYDEMTGER